VTPKSLIVNAIATDNLGTAVEAKTFRSIRPPLLVESGSSKKSLRIPGYSLDSILSNTVDLLNPRYTRVHRPAKLSDCLRQFA
jgi:hypothetical protein